MDIEKETLKVHQLEPQKSTASLASSAQNVSVSPAAFDVSKHISLVPVFRESEVEAYFVAFGSCLTSHTLTSQERKKLSLTGGVQLVKLISWCLCVS